MHTLDFEKEQDGGESRDIKRATPGKGIFLVPFKQALNRRRAEPDGSHIWESSDRVCQTNL